VGNVIATRDNDLDGLMFFWALNMWAWSGVSWLLLIVFWSPPCLQRCSARDAPGARELLSAACG